MRIVPSRRSRCRDRCWLLAENSPLLVKYVAFLVGLLVVVAFGVRPALRRAGLAAAQGCGQGVAGPRRGCTGCFETL